MEKPHKLICIGHRGTIVDFDENSLSAFKKATEYGADYIEFDINLTKDNQIIIMHDKSINRTTNGLGYLKNINYIDLQSYRTKLTKDYIPRLTDVLEELNGKVKFMLDIKVLDILYRVIDLIYQKGLISKIILSGRSLSELMKIKNLFNNILICYNMTKGIDLSLSEFMNSTKSKFLPVGINIISLKSSLITPNFINKCHENKILTFSWDFLTYKNPLDEIKKLIKWGIDGILFDDYKNIKKIKVWLKNYSLS